MAYGPSCRPDHRCAVAHAASASAAAGVLMKPGGRPLVGEQRLDFPAQRLVVCTRLIQEGRTLMRFALERRVKETVDDGPAFVVHRIFIQRRGGRSRGSPATSRCSHARAFAHSRLTVIGATPSTSAISSRVRPPKNRSSTIWAFRGSRSASSRRASSIATRSRDRSGAAASPASSTSTTRMLRPSGPFGPASGNVDQDVPHQPGRHRQEVGAVLPTDVPPVQQADERFVHQGRCLKHMARDARAGGNGEQAGGARRRRAAPAGRGRNGSLLATQTSSWVTCVGVRAGADRDDKIRRRLSPLESSEVSERAHSTNWLLEKVQARACRNLGSGHTSKEEQP